MYYLNARYYNSNTGRFLTEDTYRGRQQDPLSLHRYTYCHNNPLKYWDPTGHAAKKYAEDYFYSLTTGERYPKCEIGTSGSYVYQMEQILKAAGYNPGDTQDGIFDGNTLQAVRMFQNDNGLKVTGIVEQKAWAYLQIQPQLKELENRYKHNSISKEEYEAQVFKLKIMADRVPYKYDDKTLEVAQNKMLECYAYGAVVAASMIEVVTMVLTIGASEAMGDGADMFLDLPKAIVNPTPDTIGTVAFDAACLLLPDGPLNYADEVDDIVDLGKKAGKSGSNFRNQDLLDSHYNKHGSEFGNISKEQYLQGANDLINSTSDDILTKTRANGDIIHYNPRTNEFAVKSADGYIRTYFKPSDGLDYFNRQ